MGKRILLTGANGFVGRQIMRALSEQDVELVPVVRTGKEVEIDKATPISKVIASDDLFSESVDWWTAACEGIDTVVHTAWYTEPGDCLRSDKNVDCLQGSIALARGAIASTVRRFVGIGTCFEYDLTKRVLSMDVPLAPTSTYGDFKAALYLALSHWLPGNGIEFAWCRLFYLYGEGEHPRRLVPFIKERLSKGEPAELTSGTQIRDFLDVRKAGELIAQAALGSQQGAINICSGVPVTVRQLAERIADDFGRRDLLEFGARPDNFVDPPCVLGISNLEPTIESKETVSK